MEEWNLSDSQRADTIDRIKKNMFNMYFFSYETKPAVSDIGAIAAVIEKKAYTVAKVEAKTTTGYRPHHETLKVCNFNTWIFLLSMT
jgi:large subunit ribosomal protein L31/Ran GTPase-activating protein 1